MSACEYLRVLFLIVHGRPRCAESDATVEPKKDRPAHRVGPRALPRCRPEWAPCRTRACIRDSPRAVRRARVAARPDGAREALHRLEVASRLRGEWRGCHCQAGASSEERAREGLGFPDPVRSRMVQQGSRAPRVDCETPTWSSRCSSVRELGSHEPQTSWTGRACLARPVRGVHSSWLVSDSTLGGGPDRRPWSRSCKLRQGVFGDWNSLTARPALPADTVPSVLTDVIITALRNTHTVGGNAVSVRVSLTETVAGTHRCGCLGESGGGL